MKKIHRGSLINQRGGVSALCFAKPRAINLKVASWTNRDEAVTCEQCLDKMKELLKNDKPSKQHLRIIK